MPLGSARGVLVRLAFEGANAVPPVGRDELPHRSHFFLGSDPSKWVRDVRSYREVVYEDLYDGIDLVYRVAPEGLKYDFVLDPGTDPRVIAMRYEGAEEIRIEGGNLVVSTAAGEVHDGPPVALQEGAQVRCDFAVRSPFTIGLDCGGWNPSRPWVIDPLVYATYVGGGDIDEGLAVAVDASGSAYVTGRTWSADFPATPGAFRETLGGSSDAFVAKFDPTGSGLVYATYMGGISGGERGLAIAVDAWGSAFVTGFTLSPDFPVTLGAFNTTYSGNQDAFVAKLDPSGSALAFATYLGGNFQDAGTAIAADRDGSAYVAGNTYSTDFPVTAGAFDTTYNGTDAFVAKLEPVGTALAFATYLGGGGTELLRGLAIDVEGNAYMTGMTSSTDFPTTPGAYDTTFNGFSDAFVARLASSGSVLTYGTFLGGALADAAYSIAVQAGGIAVVTGETPSPDFPTTPGAFDTTHNGFDDAFVAALDPLGSSLVYATFLGGNGIDGGRGVALDPAGRAYVAGRTTSADFPMTSDAFDPSLDGGGDGFVAVVSPDGAVVENSTYLGGAAGDEAMAVALDPARAVYVTGVTVSVDFPVTVGAFDTTYAGGTDSFVAKFEFAVLPNASPILSWTGEAGYESDGLDPETGTSVTTFTYRVAYADADNDPPIRIEARIERPRGSPQAVLPMLFDAWLGARGNFTQGAIFRASTTLTPGTDWWYAFNGTDGRGWASGTPTVFVDAPDVVADNPPIAVAIANPTVADLGTVVTYDGTASTDDVGILAYRWDFGDGAWATVVVATHAYATRGTFTANLTVWDTADQTGTDALSIEVRNRAPVADAGPDTVAAKYALVTLNGSASRDPDEDPLTFAWAQAAGPSVTLAGADTPSPSFSPLLSGTYEFRLTVDDGWGGVGSDFVNVTVGNRAPVADAGPDRAAPKGVAVTLDGSASYDPDGDSLTYAWTQEGGPPVVLSDPNTVASTFTPLRAGTYAFRFHIVDTEGAVGEDTVSVLVPNAPPTANLIASPTTVRLGRSVDFDAGGSADPDGAIVDYGFDFGDGARSNGTAAAASHGYAAPGAYTVTLTVTDDDSATDIAQTTVTVVSNTPPIAVASAWPGKTGTSDTTFVFDGSNSTDDVAIVAWHWDFGDGTTASGASAGHRFAAKGLHTVTLTVTDDEGASASATLIVRVVNRPPVITDAQPPASVSLLAGQGQRFAITAFDPDGDALTYAWTVDETAVGAAGPVFDFASGVGVYRVNVTVSDGESAAWHEWTVRVEPPRVETNWKPLVAALFSAILALVGAWSARRAPWPTGSRQRLRTFTLTALPFVLTEAGTGVVSLLTGQLAIPPLLGAGTAVDVGILVAGISLAAYWVRKWPPPE